jgi:hypothetical protein
MRIDIPPSVIAWLRSLGAEGRPLWEAIESLRRHPTPPDAITWPERPGRYETHVRIGEQGYWLAWEIRQDRGESVIRVAAIREN